MATAFSPACLAMATSPLLPSPLMPNNPSLAAAEAVASLEATLEKSGALETTSVVLERQSSISSLGAEHPSTLAVAGRLAGVLQDQGEFSEAARILRETLKAHTRVLGAEHPCTLAVASQLVVLQQKRWPRWDRR